MSHIKSRFRGERGDVYFEFLICMILFIILFSLSIQIISAVQLKLWLDRQTASIVRHVQIRGEIDASADAMISEIENRICGDINVEWHTRFIPDTHRIQLGDQVRLCVNGEITIFQLCNSDILKVEISSEMVGTCERYWKN